MIKKYRIEQLRNVFGYYGQIASIYYPVDLKSKKYLTFAFIRFLNEKDAQKAQSSLNKTLLGERYMSIQILLFITIYILICNTNM
jgi:RNA recognition motif-containing protein